VIWEPFLLALVLGIIVSAGLYFAYLWPSVEPADDEPVTVSPPSSAEASPAAAGATGDATATSDATATATSDATTTGDAAAPHDATATDGDTSPAP
jgi:hypothetical protein